MGITCLIKAFPRRKKIQAAADWYSSPSESFIHVVLFLFFFEYFPRLMALALVARGSSGERMWRRRFPGFFSTGNWCFCGGKLGCFFYPFYNVSRADPRLVDDCSLGARNLLPWTGRGEPEPLWSPTLPHLSGLSFSFFPSQTFFSLLPFGPSFFLRRAGLVRGRLDITHEANAVPDTAALERWIGKTPSPDGPCTYRISSLGIV